MGKLLELCELQDVLNFPGIGAALSDVDIAWIGRQIRSVSKVVEGMTGREFYREARTQRFGADGLFQTRIRLPAYGGATDSLTTVHESAAFAWDATTLVPATSYYWDSRTGVLTKLYGTWLPYPGAVQVVWTAGFGIGPVDVPSDLREAAARQVAHWYRRRDDLGIQSKGVQDQSMTVFDKGPLLTEVETVVRRYGPTGF